MQLRLDQPIEIHKLTTGVDGMGSPTETWAIASGAPKWAEVRPMRGMEHIQAQQLQAVEQVKFVIRRWSSLSPEEYKVLWAGKVWDITSVEDHGRDDYQVVWAKTV